MIYRMGLLFVIEWFIVVDPSAAFMNGCVEGLCFISSPPSTNSLSWISADEWCRKNGSRLIEITNSDIQNAMFRFLNSIRSTYSYDGLRLFTNGKRISGKWTWVTGNTANYLWDYVPSDQSFAYRYLQLTDSDVTISTSRGAETKPGYICQNESQCTSTTGVILNSRCYTSYSNEYRSWYGARKRCLSRGGDLASFDFIHDKQGLSVLNSTWLSQWTSYFVGLRQEWWTWQGTTTDVRYSNWESGHPNTYPNDSHDCLCVEPSQWNWVECRCTDARPYICVSGELRSSSTVTTKIATTTTSTSKTASNLGTISTTSAAVSKGSANGDVNTFDRQPSPTTVYSSSKSAVGAESKTQENSLDDKTKIAIGVGVGGGLLVVAIAVVVVVFIIRKRSQRSVPEKKDKTKKPKSLQPPDIIAEQTTRDQAESPYGTVVRQIAHENTHEDAHSSDKPQTVYANLEILTMSSSASYSPGVANETGSSRPSSPSSLTEAVGEIGHNEMNGQQLATVTRA